MVPRKGSESEGALHREAVQRAECAVIGIPTGRPQAQNAEFPDASLISQVILL